MSDSDRESSVSSLTSTTRSQRGSDLTKRKTPGNRKASRACVRSEKQLSNGILLSTDIFVYFDIVTHSDTDKAVSKVAALEKQLKAARKAAKKAKGTHLDFPCNVC